MSQPEEPSNGTVTASPSPELLQKASELIANIELFDIRPCSLMAKLSGSANPRDLVTSVKADVTLSYLNAEGQYSNRFDYYFKLNGESSENLLADIDFSLILDYRVTEKFTPDSEAAEFVTKTTGLFAAYPYARELVQSLAGRLQFDPIVLGHLKRGSFTPESVNVLRQSDTQD